MGYALYVAEGEVDADGEFHGALFIDIGLPDARTIRQAERLVRYYSQRLPPDFGGLLVAAFDIDGDGRVAAYAEVPKLILDTL